MEAHHQSSIASLHHPHLPEKHSYKGNLKAFFFLCIFFFLSFDEKQQLPPLFFSEAKAIHQAHKKTSELKKFHFIGDLRREADESCFITAASEGDNARCHCPAGYILCTEQDVRDSTRFALDPPSWLQALCRKEEKEGGFFGVSVYVDYEKHIQCQEPYEHLKSNKGNLRESENLRESDKKSGSAEGGRVREAKVLKYTYISASTGSEISPDIINRLKDDKAAVARTCLISNFYLCKKNIDNKKINCKMSEWGDWGSYCFNGIQKRRRSILQSGQNGGEMCLTGGHYPRQDIVTEERECPTSMPYNRRFYDNS